MMTRQEEINYMLDEFASSDSQEAMVLWLYPNQIERVSKDNRFTILVPQDMTCKTKKYKCAITKAGNNK